MAISKEGKPLHELLSRSQVDIYVGPSHTHWTLHEKLLCHHSPFFQRIFQSKPSASPSEDEKSYSLPDEEDPAFRLLVGWLYSTSIRAPTAEKDLTDLFDLYLMAVKFGMVDLIADVLYTVRTWYRSTNTYPGLRRLQYIYANTETADPMRDMLVSAIARMLALSRDGIPKHWDKALRKNGQLAVDIILAVQGWRIEEERVPDVRAEEVEAGLDADALGAGVGTGEVEKAGNVKDEIAAKKEGEREKLQRELPNGLQNGV